MSAHGNALLSVLLAMSAAFAAPIDGFAQDASEGPMAAVAVQNNSDTNIRVYLLQKGHMVPLGLVAERANATLSIPEPFLETAEPIHLVADAIGSSRFHKTEALTVGPQSQIEFTLESDLGRSIVGLSG